MSEKTERCQICRQEKPVSQIDMTEGNYTSGICLDCIQTQKDKLLATGAKLIETQEPNVWSGWHCKYVTYKYITIQACQKSITLRRRFSNLCYKWDSAELFGYVNQLIANNYQEVCYYGKLELLKEKDFWFDISKEGQFYHMGGNCFEYSNAFQIDAVNVERLFEYVEKWVKFPAGLKQHIIKQIDSGLVFASNPKPFEREKVFCFKDYSEYKTQHDKPKILILKGLEVAQ